MTYIQLVPAQRIGAGTERSRLDRMQAGAMKSTIATTTREISGAAPSARACPH